MLLAVLTVEDTFGLDDDAIRKDEVWCILVVGSRNHIVDIMAFVLRFDAVLFQPLLVLGLKSRAVGTHRVPPFWCPCSHD
ncbi:acyl carrier protein [Escherichia phage IMM-002]|uniref:Acyl carrier protein n=1 Tax=Escherichia phage IMM-002 TaxID=2041760 RepID=A0A384WXW5_9CAUD|nr:acyl carrier protein [Escherichia phage IMM-002]ATI16989.1 acyl carrier protein [Escherichia phage IMM-002]